MKYLLILLVLSACGQQNNSPASVSTATHKALQSTWVTTGTSPFNAISLVGDSFNASSLAQVIPVSQSGVGCDSNVNINGDDNTGTSQIVTVRADPSCTQYNGSTFTYKRINDLTMQFCIGGSCATYQ